ncbi:MAG: beta strand repeat-containing protein, partial [Roseimicrobium sp.]
GVLAWNYARNEFVGNTMDGGEHGIGINTPLIPYAEVLAQGNRISNTTFNSIAISAGGTDIDATIIGNTVSGSQQGNGIGVGAASGAVVNATIAGNTLENNALSGIYLSQDSTTPGKGALNATITGNYISGSPLGMDITKLTQEGDMAVTMTGNTIAATGNTAVYASMGGNGTNTYHLLDNHFIKGGVLLEHVDGSGVLDVTVTGNTFNNGYVEAFNANSLTVVNNLIETSVTYQTMLVLRTNRENATLVVQDNRLYATFGHGIFIDSSDSSDLDVTIEQNTIVAHGPQTRGINLRQVENAVITGSISSNNVYSTGSGIGLSAIGTTGGFTDMTVANNAVTGFEYYGIEAEAGVGAAIDVTIAGNFTSGTAGNGLSLFSQDTTSAFTAVVENNEFQTGGLNVNLVLPTTADITIRGNAITGDVEIREADVLMFTDNTIKDADGLAVYYHEAGSATISRNTMTGNTVNGMVLSHLGASGVVTATFADNTIESAQGTGINIQSSFGGTVSVAISGNDMENTGIAGVYLGASGAGSTLTVTDMSSNTIQGAANFGILMESTGGGALSVSGFDGNSITGTTSGSHLVLFTDATSTLSVLGTVEDNTATPTPNPNGVTLDITGTPTVDFLLNGVHITLPVSVP